MDKFHAYWKHGEGEYMKNTVHVAGGIVSSLQQCIVEIMGKAQHINALS